MDVTPLPLPPWAAARCAVRTELDWAAKASGEVAADRVVTAPGSAGDIRAQAARQHTVDICRLLASEVDPRFGSVVVIDANASDSPEDQTRAALASEARVIVGPRLGVGPGGQAGNPAALARGDDATSRSSANPWVPIIVERHLLTERHDTATLRQSPLATPHPECSTEVEATAVRSNRQNGDGLALAHHWRLLQSLGLAPSDHATPPSSALGGVIDRTGALWWIPLDRPRIPNQITGDTATLLDRYDQAFALRQAVAANALERVENPQMPRLVEPALIDECNDCPWRVRCRRELEAADHVSLLPRSRPGDPAIHGARGVHTRADVAGLNWLTAAALFGERPGHGNDSSATAELIADASGRLPATPLLAIARPEHHAAASRLRHLGLTTVADLDRLDERTLAYAGTDVAHLPNSIDQARAITSRRVHRARGLVTIDVTRADIEVDVDMENVEDGVYLWGVLVSGRAEDLAAVGVRDGYQPFFSWEPMGPSVQAEVFGRFWRWFTDLRRRATDTGRSFAAYCYARAEYDKMRQVLAEAPPAADRPGIELPTGDEVDELAGSPQWVDLYDVVRHSLITGNGLGLKKVAPLAGFGWRDDDAGGLQSMWWHNQAVTHPDPEVRATNRTRLLAYNEDDVRATLALRTWLTNTPLPPIESAGP